MYEYSYCKFKKKTPKSLKDGRLLNDDLKLYYFYIYRYTSKEDVTSLSDISFT